LWKTVGCGTLIVRAIEYAGRFRNEQFETLRSGAASSETEFIRADNKQTKLIP
jgi:hypothetical protein